MQNKKIGFFLIFLTSFLLIILVGFYLTGNLVGELSVGVDEGIIVIYNEFKSIGSTTNLLAMNDTQLQNISSLTLENTYGKIVFLNEVNLTQDLVFNTINLDSNINLSNNFLNVSSELDSVMEKNVTIYFYNLSFISPSVYKNGALCSDCEIISYTDYTLTFNAFNFSGIVLASKKISMTNMLWESLRKIKIC